MYNDIELQVKEKLKVQSKVIPCGTCPLAFLWLPQSANFRDIEVFLFLFGKILEDINFHFRAFCNNPLHNEIVILLAENRRLCRHR